MAKRSEKRAKPVWTIHWKDGTVRATTARNIAEAAMEVLSRNGNVASVSISYPRARKLVPRTPAPRRKNKKGKAR